MSATRQDTTVLPERLPFLNSLTKYPSIPCWHPMGDRGVMADAPATHPPGPYLATEKIDGTNARIILTPGCYLIGSREELLTHSGDVVFNPSQGIVEAIRPIAERVITQGWAFGRNPLTVIYGEVYGGKVGANAKNYSAPGFRVFDVLSMGADNFDTLALKSPAALSAWREEGKQPFVDSDALAAFCERMDLPVGPAAGSVEAPPAGQEHVLAWLREQTQRCPHFAAMTPDQSEGLVLRTPDRSWTCKVRREDYERAARRKTR